MKVTEELQTEKSRVDPDYQLITYPIGVEYIIYNSACFPVDCEFNKTGTILKKIYFPPNENKLNPNLQAFIDTL